MPIARLLARMLFWAERRAVGIVVQAGVLLTPEDEDRMLGCQRQAHHGLETGPPAIWGAQNRGLPVVATDSLCHLAVASQKVDLHGQEYRSVNRPPRTITADSDYRSHSNRVDDRMNDSPSDVSAGQDPPPDDGEVLDRDRRSPVGRIRPLVL